MSDAQLWRAVVTQALADAQTTGKLPAVEYDRRQAREWLTSKSADFAEVCALADLDPSAVRALALELIDKADATSGDSRRSPTLTDSHGLTLNLSQWARRTGVSRATLHNRIKAGWSHEKILTTPAAKTGPRKSKAEVQAHA